MKSHDEMREFAEESLGAAIDINDADRMNNLADMVLELLEHNKAACALAVRNNDATVEGLLREGELQAQLDTLKVENEKLKANAFINSSRIETLEVEIESLEIDNIQLKPQLQSARQVLSQKGCNCGIKEIISE